MDYKTITYLVDKFHKLAKWVNPDGTPFEGGDDIIRYDPYAPAKPAGPQGEIKSKDDPRWHEGMASDYRKYDENTGFYRDPGTAPSSPERIETQLSELPMYIRNVSEMLELAQDPPPGYDIPPLSPADYREVKRLTSRMHAVMGQVKKDIRNYGVSLRSVERYVAALEDLRQQIHEIHPGVSYNLFVALETISQGIIGKTGPDKPKPDGAGKIGPPIGPPPPPEEDYGPPMEDPLEDDGEAGGSGWYPTTRYPDAGAGGARPSRGAGGAPVSPGDRNNPLYGDPRDGSTIVYPTGPPPPGGWDAFYNEPEPEPEKEEYMTYDPQGTGGAPGAPGRWH